MTGVMVVDTDWYCESVVFMGEEVENEKLISTLADVYSSDTITVVMVVIKSNVVVGIKCSGGGRDPGKLFSMFSLFSKAFAFRFLQYAWSHVSLQVMKLSVSSVQGWVGRWLCNQKVFNVLWEVSTPNV